MKTPFETGHDWGKLRVGGLLVPGIVTKIEGPALIWEWAVQSGLGIGGKSTVYKSPGLVEEIKVTSALYGQPAFAAWVDTLIPTLSPKPGLKPRAFGADHPALRHAKIPKVVVRKIVIPVSMGKQAWMGELILMAYQPTIPIKVGKPDPAKVDGPPKPADFLEKALQDALKQAGIGPQ